MSFNSSMESALLKASANGTGALDQGFAVEKNYLTWNGDSTQDRASCASGMC